jgi:hypothetical protein
VAARFFERQGQDENGPLFICFDGGGSPEQLTPLIETSSLACRFALLEYRIMQPEQSMPIRCKSSKDRIPASIKL